MEESTPAGIREVIEWSKSNTPSQLPVPHNQALLEVPSPQAAKTGPSFFTLQSFSQFSRSYTGSSPLRELLAQTEKLQPFPSTSAPLDFLYNHVEIIPCEETTETQPEQESGTIQHVTGAPDKILSLEDNLKKILAARKNSASKASDSPPVQKATPPWSTEPCKTRPPDSGSTQLTSTISKSSPLHQNSRFLSSVTPSAPSDGLTLVAAASATKNTTALAPSARLFDVSSNTLLSSATVMTTKETSLELISPPTPSHQLLLNAKRESQKKSEGFAPPVSRLQKSDTKPPHEKSHPAERFFFSSLPVEEHRRFVDSCCNLSHQDISSYARNTQKKESHFRSLLSLKRNFSRGSEKSKRGSGNTKGIKH